MTELTIDGKPYVSSKRAAEITGYAKDYIGQLCREGRVTAKLVGRSWYVLESSIREHRFGVEEAKAPAPKRSSVVSSTWETPTYHAEEPQHLPDMPEKPVLATAKPDPGTLAAMHSAWQEWFSLKQGAQMEPAHLLADHEEGSAAPEPRISIDELVSMTKIDPTETHVAFTAVAEPVSPHEPEESGFIDSKPVSIPIDRIMPAVPARSAYVPAAAGYAETVFEEEVYEETHSSVLGVVLRSAFIAIAVVVVAIGVLGSGVADGYLAKLGLTRYVSSFTGDSVYTK